MPEEIIEKKEEDTLSFKTAEELTTFLMDMQGQLANMQQTIDKLSPVEEEVKEDVKEEVTTEEPTAEEISEIDKLLQEN